MATLRDEVRFYLQRLKCMKTLKLSLNMNRDCHQTNFIKVLRIAKSQAVPLWFCLNSTYCGYSTEVDTPIKKILQNVKHVTSRQLLHTSLSAENPIPIFVR